MLFQPVTPKEKQVAIKRILPYRADNDTEPDSTLDESLEVWGPDHSSVLLLETDEGFKVFEGRKRIDAYKRKDIATIRALVYPKGTSEDYLAGVALATHLTRKRNPLDEAAQIKMLRNKGWTLEDIATHLKHPINSVRKLDAINQFPNHVVQAIREGRMNVEGGYSYLRLDKGSKGRLDTEIEAGEKIKAKEIKEIRKAANSQAYAEALFQIPQYEPPTAEQLFRNAVVQALNSGLSLERLQTIVLESGHHARAA
jgi:transcriptional regulator